MNFSIHDRPEFIDKLKSEKFDLLIIGGGITGAGIALDAASRGLKTGLLEKNDFAFGTSSRSTKLIHGGLRYLKQLEFGLVREVGSERAVVHKLAPHLVVPEKMLLPLYEKRGFGSILTSFGLKLYDWLAGVRPEDQRRMLTRRQTLRQEPLLREKDIKGGAIYAEYRTDDARLTLEIMKTAFRHGALTASYCEVTGFCYQDGKVIGVKAFDHQTSTAFEVKAAVIVNAAGPWVDELREADQSRQGKRLHLTKGVHIVVPRDKLMVQQAIYFDVDDGRMIFAIPRARTTYVGTTDTSYSGSKNEVVASREDVEYLLRAVNKTFHISPLGFSDVESSWAGLRPLIHEDGKSTSELSRKDEIFESPSGLISIAGGKLTGYRKMAERVVNLVIERSFDQLHLKSCYTRKINLTEAAFSSDKDVRKFVGVISTEVRRLGGEQTIASYLVHTYGKQTIEILENLKNNVQSDIHRSLIHAELQFAISKEMVVCPLDFFVRRTGMLFFDIGRMNQFKELVITEFKKIFDWNEDKVQAERKRIEDSINLASQFL